MSECAEWRGWMWKRLIVALVFMCVITSAVCDFLISAVWWKLTNKGCASSSV